MSFVLYPDLWVHGQASCNVLGSGITKNYLISLFVIDHFGVLLFVVLENEEKVNCELLEVLTGGEMAQTAGVLAEPTDSGWPDARCQSGQRHAWKSQKWTSISSEQSWNETPLNNFSTIILQILGGHLKILVVTSSFVQSGAIANADICLIFFQDLFLM